MFDESDVALSTLQSLSDRADLAALLGTTTRELNFILYALSPRRRYREFRIRKRSGKSRIIRAPIPPLKELQSRIARILEQHYVPRPCVYGYVQERSIQENAARHVRKRWVLRVDLKDFFPTINFGRVRGMLLAEPFALQPVVATTIAQLCCHLNELPQGSPASPVISNLVSRGLDRALARLARANLCTYTRYCDDLVFSTTRRTFPVALAVRENDGDSQVVAVGDLLEQEITRAGFSVNPEKVTLRAAHQRQMVTGIVTNERVNVPRTFVRSVRAVLFAWKRYGLTEVSSWYAAHDPKNRPPGKAPPRLADVVKGKVQYIGSVRGWDDRAYMSLARMLSGVDPTFKPTRRTVADRLRPLKSPKLHVFVEGPTDKTHLELAFSELQRKGRFQNLELVIDGKERGSQELLKLCKSLSEKHQNPPCVFVFDSDEPRIVSSVTDTVGDPKDWGNGVMSLVLPVPVHRSQESRLCIELLYKDSDLTRTDDSGRRLFLSSEFKPRSGHHKSLDAYCVSPNKTTLVMDDHVFAHDERKLSLSKVGFAQLAVQHAANIDFEGFSSLFEALVKICNRLTERGEHRVAARVR